MNSGAWLCDLGLSFSVPFFPRKLQTVITPARGTLCEYKRVKSRAAWYRCLFSVVLAAQFPRLSGPADISSPGTSLLRAHWLPEAEVPRRVQLPAASVVTLKMKEVRGCKGDSFLSFIFFFC